MICNEIAQTLNKSRKNIYFLYVMETKSKLKENMLKKKNNSDHMHSLTDMNKEAHIENQRMHTKLASYILKYLYFF